MGRLTSLLGIAVAGMLVAGCDDSEQNTVDPVTTAISAAPEFYDHLIQEAEKPTYHVGGRIKMRSNASKARTWNMIQGESADYAVDLRQGTKYSVAGRYSDDGGRDVIMASVEGREIGRFSTTSTGGWGAGWNNFVFSPNFYFTTPGTNTEEGIFVNVRLENISSANGSEMDCLHINKVLEE